MYYYDVVKSTYNDDLTVRHNSELIIGGCKDEDEACQRARELIWENDDLKKCFVGHSQRVM